MSEKDSEVLMDGTSKQTFSRTRWEYKSGNMALSVINIYLKLQYLKLQLRIKSSHSWRVCSGKKQATVGSLRSIGNMSI